MIPEDYEQLIKNGSSLGKVLAGRTPEDADLVLDAVMVWLENSTTVNFSVSPIVQLKLIEQELPEYAGDPWIEDAVRGEVHRRNASELRAKNNNDISTHCGPPLQDGKGRYELLDRIGGGGQGTVFRGVDRKFRGAARSQVAVKFLVGKTSNEGVRTRGVDHPGVVRVHDEGVDEQSGRPYIVYEYLDGLRLDGWAERRTLDPRMIARLMLRLCDAASAIHRALIVHRDLKPGNIIVCGDRPVIADFGIAVEGLEDWSPAGTPLALAPELRHGQGSTLVDIYGLGVVLYFLLCSELPGSDGDLHMDSPGCIRSEGLWAVAARCLQTHPPDRYQSAESLAKDLRAFLDNRPMTALPTGSIARAGLSVRRRPVLSVLALLLVASVLWILVGQWGEIEAGKADRAAVRKQLAESSKRTNLLTTTNSYSQRVIHRSILDMRLREMPIDPAMYWAIAELGDKAGWEDWTYAMLVTEKGAEMLRQEVTRRSNDPNESQVSIGYWWWLLARVEKNTGGVPEEQVADAYRMARVAMAEAVGENDPLVGVLDRELAGE